MEVTQMFKKFFSLSNPLGLALTAATLILSLSPEARRGTRKLLVKGTAAVLSIGDQVKELSGGARKQLGSFVNEAKAEKERLPEFSEMFKETGESMKENVNDMADKMKQSVQATSAFAMESAEELLDDITKEDHKINNKGMKKMKQKPSAHVPRNYHQAHNVLSDEAIRQRLTNFDQ